MDYIDEFGSIDLTPSKAFKRSFVHWAAAEFDWPGYTEADLFALNKVLNEIDFPPLMVLHELLIALKIGRHYKGKFKLTHEAAALVGHPGRIFKAIVPDFLLRVGHTQMSRFQDEPILGNWDIFFNVLNVEAENGATGAELRSVLYGEPETRFDRMLSSLYVQVLRPLCWAGLLQELPGENRHSISQSMFIKTPLWQSALKLDTDDAVAPTTRP